MRVRFANFDENAMPDGYVVAQDVAVPKSTSTQYVEELFPVLENGTWTRQYVVVNLTAEQIAFAEESLIEINKKYNNINNNNNNNLSGSAPNVIE